MTVVSSAPIIPCLQHHGAAPELPGYTTPELVELTRSAFPGQRTISFNTLAAVLERRRVAVAAGACVFPCGVCVVWGCMLLWHGVGWHA